MTDAVSTVATSKKFKFPIVTGTLLAVLVTAYIAELLMIGGPTLGGPKSNGSELILLGGVNRTFIVDQGQWYRLVTATFLHLNFLHLLMNGIVLLFCGSLLESKIGRAWFLALYTVSGLAGSCMSLALNGTNVNSVGASGAIMGVLAGAFVVTFREPKGGGRIRAQASLLRLLVPALLPSAANQHIDVSGHLGGAIAGALFAIILMMIWESETEQPKFQRFAKALPLAALPILLIGLPSGIATGSLFQGLSAEQVGQYSEAEAAFDRAIQLQPKFIDEVAGQRAIARFSNGHYGGAADDFRKLVNLKPDWAYAPLFLHITRFHMKEDDRDEFAANTNRIDLVNWPGPALALFLGRATPEGVLQTAAQAEAKKNENQSCEASFYVGEWSLMRGLFDKATPLIKKAAETCPLEFFEHKFAVAELAHSSLRR